MNGYRFNLARFVVTGFVVAVLVLSGYFFGITGDGRTNGELGITVSVGLFVLEALNAAVGSTRCSCEDSNESEG